MNYRHIYHAGNICDVVKHTVLVLLVEHLRAKDGSFCVLDTHSGVGLYDLQDPRAAKTNEAQAGILKLLAAPRIPELAEYYSILTQVQKNSPPLEGGVRGGVYESKNFMHPPPNLPLKGGGTPPSMPQNVSLEALRFYPGSPLLIYRLLRAQDKLVACELHEEDARELKRTFFEHNQAQIHHRDGYEGLKAFLPPEEKRGCVLIDPPFEQPDEFAKLVTAVADAYKRWPQGMFLIWYPVKERPAIWRFHEALIALGIPKQLCAEFIFEEESRADRLNGCGLILINPPWKMDERLGALFPALHKALQTTHRQNDVKWLTDESVNHT